RVDPSKTTPEPLTTKGLPSTHTIPAPFLSGLSQPANPDALAVSVLRVSVPPSMVYTRALCCGTTVTSVPLIDTPCKSLLAPPDHVLLPERISGPDCTPVTGSRRCTHSSRLYTDATIRLVPSLPKAFRP